MKIKEYSGYILNDKNIISSNLTQKNGAKTKLRKTHHIQIEIYKNQVVVLIFQIV